MHTQFLRTRNSSIPVLGFSKMNNILRGMYTSFRLYGSRIYGFFGYLVQFLLVPNEMEFHTIEYFGYMTQIFGYMVYFPPLFFQNFRNLGSKIGLIQVCIDCSRMFRQTHNFSTICGWIWLNMPSIPLQVSLLCCWPEPPSRFYLKLVEPCYPQGGSMETMKLS